MVKNQDQTSEIDLALGEDYPKAKVSPILKWSIIIMSTLIVVILVVIISTIIYRAVKLGDRGSTKTYSAQGFGTVDLEVSKGAKVGSATLNGNKMTIVINRDAGGDEIVIFDVRGGNVIGRIQLKEK